MASAELFVLKYVQICFISYLVKIIHIELPHEWGEVAMSEVNRQYLFLELLDILNNEGSSILIPSDDVFELFILNRNNFYLKNFKSLRNKDRRAWCSLLAYFSPNCSLFPLVAVPKTVTLNILFCKVFLYLHRNI